MVEDLGFERLGFRVEWGSGFRGSRECTGVYGNLGVQGLGVGGVVEAKGLENLGCFRGLLHLTKGSQTRYTSIYVYMHLFL